MEKIIELALKTTGLNDQQISALITIAEATPNFETAINLFLGVYEHPEISKTKVSMKGIVCNLVSYNIFTDCVTIKSEPYTRYKYYENFNSETGEFSGRWEWYKSSKLQHEKLYKEDEISEITIPLDDWESGDFNF